MTMHRMTIQRGMFGSRRRERGALLAPVTKIILTVSACAALFSGCAAFEGGIPGEYKGSLEPGDVRNASLESADRWTFYGEKGSRVVIMDAVNREGAPPEICLLPPESSSCEACGNEMGHGYRILDHELESTGEYTLLINQPGGSPGLENYVVSLARLIDAGSYRIGPGDQDGQNLDPCRNISVEPATEVGSNSLIAGFYTVTPYLVAPAMIITDQIFGLFSSIWDGSETETGKKETVRGHTDSLAAHHGSG